MAIDNRRHERRPPTRTNTGSKGINEGVDLGKAYHKRPDLASALVKRVAQLRKAKAVAPRPRHSVSSTGRTERVWKLGDRVSDADVRLMADAFWRGTPKWKLAEQYGISESSVKRLLRKHRQVAERSA